MPSRPQFKFTDLPGRQAGLGENTPTASSSSQCKSSVHNIPPAGKQLIMWQKPKTYFDFAFPNMLTQICCHCSGEICTTSRAVAKLGCLKPDLTELLFCSCPLNCPGSGLHRQSSGCSVRAASCALRPGGACAVPPLGRVKVAGSLRGTSPHPPLPVSSCQPTIRRTNTFPQIPDAAAM